MSDPDGNTAMERLHNDGLEPREEKLHEDECLDIVKDMLQHDDQRAIEIFDELSDPSKAALIRLAFSNWPVAAGEALKSYSKAPWIQDYAWERIQERREEAEAEHSSKYD